MGRKMKKRLFFWIVQDEFNQLSLPFWKKPDFLIFILGLINIFGMLGTYFWASKRIDPQEAVLWVALESSLVLIVGNFILELFKKSLSALKMKKDFISIISHQLRNPLTVIKWSLEGIIQEAENLTKKQRHQIKKMIVANETLIELSNNFIFLERLEDDKNFQKEKIDAVLLIKNKIKEVVSFAEEKKLKIKTFFGQKKRFVLANEDFLNIIFDNFLSNSIRYSFEKTVISVRIKEEKGNVFFYFENKGIGIKKEEEDLLFEKFYRSDSAKEFSPQGSGLGLYISKFLTDKMKGKIGFKSRKNVTIFWVSFPEIKN